MRETRLRRIRRLDQVWMTLVNSRRNRGGNKSDKQVVLDKCSWEEKMESRLYVQHREFISGIGNVNSDKGRFSGCATPTRTYNDRNTLHSPFGWMS